jgi:hypothetical protein
MIVGAILLMAGLYYLLSPDERYDWHSHEYQSKGGEPYDADLLVLYLEQLRSEQGVEHMSSSFEENLDILIERGEPVNYIYYGLQPSFEYEDLELIEDLLANGSSIYLLSGAPSVDAEEMFLNDRDDYEYELNFERQDYVQVGSRITAESVNLNFTHPDLKTETPWRFAHRVRTEEQSYIWPTISEEIRNRDNVVVLGTADDSINFIRIEYGAGELYYLSTPKVLSNYYLTRPEGKAYADGLFSHLDDRPVVWDERVNGDGNNGFSSNRYEQGQGGLTFILSREPLRWAFYTLLFGVLLLFVLGAQRRQRAIPVIKSKSNSSLEYVDTITELYYSQGGHGRIYSYLSEELNRFIRERYHVPLRWESPQELEQFAKTSGITTSELESLRYLYKQGVNESDVNAISLRSYYEGLTRFFTQAK